MHNLGAQAALWGRKNTQLHNCKFIGKHPVLETETRVVSCSMSQLLPTYFVSVCVFFPFSWYWTLYIIYDCPGILDSHFGNLSPCWIIYSPATSTAFISFSQVGQICSLGDFDSHSHHFLALELRNPESLATASSSASLVRRCCVFPRPSGWFTGERRELQFPAALGSLACLRLRLPPPLALRLLLLLLKG